MGERRGAGQGVQVLSVSTDSRLTVNSGDHRNRPAKFWVEQELTHGFLQFYGLGGVEVTAANERVIECLIEAFRTEPM